MDRKASYYRQTALLMQVLPFVAEHRCFALKGGTGINLFVRDMPRLSVDIDLVYLPLEPRAQALANMRKSLVELEARLNSMAGLSGRIQTNREDELRLLVENAEAQIKIEVSPVIRGTLRETTVLDVAPSTEEEFGFASMQVVARADLYGGKFCAALDRQNPRDLFDVKVLLAEEGLDRDLFDGFITYLISHNRPMADLLKPRWKNIDEQFHRDFVGMAFEAVTLEDLYLVREQLLAELKANFTVRDYDFLFSFKKGQPDWDSAPDGRLSELPAIRWKLLNIKRMEVDKRNLAVKRLEDVLQAWIE